MNKRETRFNSSRGTLQEISKILQTTLTAAIDATILFSFAFFTIQFVAGLLPTQRIQPTPLPTPSEPTQSIQPTPAVTTEELLDQTTPAVTTEAPIEVPTPAVTTTTPDYNSMSLAELRAIGTSRAVVPCDRRRRDAWVTALQTADHNDAVLLGATAETLGLL